MTTVTLREGETMDSLISRFRKKVTDGRILSAAKKSRFFVSPSEQRRIALRKAVRRERKRQRREARKLLRG